MNTSLNSSANVGRHIVLQNEVAASSPLRSPSPLSQAGSPSSHSSKLILFASPL